MVDVGAPLIALAAGGTGGHIFPAEALARALLARGARVALITDPRGQAFSGELGVPVYRIAARSPSGNLMRKIIGALSLGVGVVQAADHLRRLKPAAVVGFGGYPAAPTVYAAAKMKLPVLLHEQNAVLGRANRLLSSLAHKIAVSFPAIEGAQTLKPEQIIITGNPVRPAIAALRHLPYPAILPDTPIQILVLGGSLGARVFGALVPAAVALLAPEQRARLKISQQCRAEDMDAAQQAYAALDMPVELATFFKDVPERLAQAHLVISRSGASTVAELGAAGRPAVLVPYPYARADEQTANADAFVQAGGGWLLPEDVLTRETLAKRLENLLTQPMLLESAAASARAFGTDKAADNLASAVLSLAHVSSAPAVSDKAA